MLSLSSATKEIIAERGTYCLLFLITFILIQINVFTITFTLVDHSFDNVECLMKHKKIDNTEKRDITEILNIDKIEVIGVDSFDEKNYIPIFNRIHLTKDYNEIVIIINDGTAYYEFYYNTDKFLDILLSVEEPALVIFLIIFFLLVFYFKKELLAERLLATSNEIMLTNQSMISIAENLHHELNTPLEVLENKIEKIKRVIKKSLALKTIEEIESDPLAKQLHDLEKDFKFIDNASEQIFSILDKMKGFKHIKYSNGNKTLYDIVTTAFSIIEINKTQFSHHTDLKFKNYRLKSDILKNGELLSILINHIKNSLEANATKVLITFAKYDEKREFLYFRIIDNGHGIPKEQLKKLFKPNSSSKKSASQPRGNGMFLNDMIISEAGGKIEVIKTSNQGTIFQLKVPAIKLN